MAAPLRIDDVGECVEATLRRLGKRIVLAAPLAIGKPNLLLNEFYRRAARDPTLSLTILTALSLNRPTGRSELERRFLEPFVARVFGDYPDLDYVKAARAPSSSASRSSVMSGFELRLHSSRPATLRVATCCARTLTPSASASRTTWV